jgi:tetratricopeptide (TPR) repeat protein
MSVDFEKLAIYIVIGVIGVVFFVVKKALRGAKGKKGDQLVEQGNYKDAIEAYRKQLLGTLELGKGSMNKDNPGIFLRDAQNGIKILEKINEAYKKAGHSPDTAKYEQLMSELDALISNKENIGLTRKLKKPAQKQFMRIRADFKTFICEGLPSI